jgi:transcription elongation factor GreA
MADTSYLTAEGLEKLRKEVDYLKNTARVELSNRLREAIQMGDLSENADYIQAKEEQGFLEGRIQELDTILNNVVIIDDKDKSNDRVDIGSTVTVQESSYPQESYYVVGPKEADPVNGRISYESPIGKSLLGHSVGDTIQVETPGGKVNLKIIKIN